MHAERIAAELMLTAEEAEAMLALIRAASPAYCHPLFTAGVKLRREIEDSTAANLGQDGRLEDVIAQRNSAMRQLQAVRQALREATP